MNDADLDVLYSCRRVSAVVIVLMFSSQWLLACGTNKTANNIKRTDYGDSSPITGTSGAPMGMGASGTMVAPGSGEMGGSMAPAGGGAITGTAGMNVAGTGAMAANQAGTGSLGNAADAGTGSADAGVMQQPETPPADCPADPQPTGDQTYTLMSSNGTTYTYILSVPDSVDRMKKAPLIVSWHALQSSPEEMRMLTAVDQLGETTKSIMVYPKSPDASWNTGSCCTATTGGRQSDETVFARELVKDVESKVCVDQHRIYTTGFSNGGMMTQMLACKAADLFAAAFPMGSTLTVPESECTFSRPIPIMMINGTADPLVGYDTPSFAGGLSVPDDFAMWAQKNGCTGDPEITFQKGQTTCRTYKNCAGGVETTSCAVEGMGHCVPGMKKESDTNCVTKTIPLGMPNDDMDAVKVSGDFLLRWRLP